MVPWSLQFRANDARLSTPQTFLLLHSKRSAKVDATCQLEPGGKTIRNSAVFLCLFLFIFPSFLHLCPCEGSVFFVLFGLTFFGTCLKDSVGAHLTVREGVRDLKSLVMVTGRSQDSLPARLPRLALHMDAYGSKLFESRQ